MVTVSPAYAVGMQHWGPLTLQNNQPHIVFAELTNPKDPNALAVYDGHMTKDIGGVGFKNGTTSSGWWHLF